MPRPRVRTLLIAAMALASTGCGSGDKLTPEAAAQAIRQINQKNGGPPLQSAICIHKEGSDQSFICTVVTASGARGQSEYDCESSKASASCINRPLSGAQEP